MDHEQEERRDLEKRMQAELQVEAFIELLARRYNLKSEDIPRIVEDWRWLHERRAAFVRLQWSIALGILAIALSGVWSALLTGIKQILKGT